jgi:phage baseplate assembly protein gpV
MGGMIRIGQVEAVNTSKNTVSVRHNDTETVSKNLPLMCPKLRPEVGDTVLTVFLSNGPAYGICLGGFYQESNVPSSGALEGMVLPDGASITYDPATKTLALTAAHVVVNGKEVGV